MFCLDISSSDCTVGSDSVLLLWLHFTSLTDRSFCGTKTMTEKKKKKETSESSTVGAGFSKVRSKKTRKGSNERLFVLTRTHSMHIFGEIPFIKYLCVCLDLVLERWQPFGFRPSSLFFPSFFFFLLYIYIFYFFIFFYSKVSS